MYSIEEIAKAELAARERLAEKIMSIIELKYQTGDGYAKRGQVQNYVYHYLGFHGRSGNHFAKFINKILTEKGYRCSWRHKNRVYYGLFEKPVG